MADVSSAAGEGRTPAPSPTPAPAEKLDQLMLAMDVVDTLRHADSLVAKELSQGDRDEVLKTRLRELYHSQGITVPDSVIMEGIRALAEARFVYTPPRPSLARTLALLWVRRRPIGFGAAGAVLALTLLWGGWQMLVEGPRQSAAEAARIELEQSLPQRLKTLHASIHAEARVDVAKTEADKALRDGEGALARGDADAAREAAGRLETLERALKEEYVLRIVARPGEDSGVVRVPDVNESARNFYLVVEAVAPDGRVLELPVRSEENSRVERVSKWGVRVAQAVFEQVALDKRDDGIIQNDIVGQKQRGFLEPEYRISILSGAITRW